MQTTSEPALIELIRTYRSGYSLPGAFCRQPAVFRLDLTAIFGHHWLFCGHASQLSRPGDYFTYQIGNEALIIIRSSEHDIGAYFNFCRHRGSRILTEGSGHVKGLICPYHQWTYGLDGALLKAHFMPETFAVRDFGLKSAYVRVLEGLVFVSLSEAPSDLTEVEQDLIAHVRLHDLARAKMSSSRSYWVRANWKILNENARECYHCPGAHPEYCRAVISASAATSKPAMERARIIQAQEEQRWRALGIDAENKPFRPGMLHSVSRFALQPDMATESLDGQPVAPLMGKLPARDVGVVGAGIYPNFLMEASSDHTVTLRFTPMAAELTEVTVTWYVHGDAREHTDYVPEHVEAIWRATAEQDWVLCEANQLGVNSGRYTPGPYATNEWGCDHFDHWYVAELRRRLKGLYTSVGEAMDRS